MTIDVFLLPAYLRGDELAGKTVIVFDVLRATTTITSAFLAGIRRIHAYASLEEAQVAASAMHPRPLVSGEIKAIAPPGFDLGNSPRQFLPEHAGRDLVMATTNGTKALAASRKAADLLCGALVNATAVTRAAIDTQRDIVLLCSGTAGQISLEDTIGAGAVCDRLLASGNYTLATDTARIAHRLYLITKDHLPNTLRDAQGGRNCIAAGLEADIDFVARLDVIDLVGVVDPKTLVILPWHDELTQKTGS